MNQINSYQQLKYFLVYKFTLNYPTWLKQLGAFLGIFTVVTGFLLLNTPADAFDDIYLMLYIVTLFACGYYITSRSFYELESTAKGFLFMQLPVSTTIKFWVPAIFSGIIFPILFTFFYAFVVDISNALWSLFYQFNPYRFTIINEHVIIAFKTSLLFQAYFLIGSIGFKKQHLLKSALAIATVFAGLLTLLIPISRMAFGTFDHNGSILGNFQITAYGFTYSDVLILVALGIGWIIAYFKLKEREV